LAEYEYKDSNKSIRVLFESEHAYNQTKRKPEGVGQTTILKFLGKEVAKYEKIEDLPLKLLNLVDSKSNELL